MKKEAFITRYHAEMTDVRVSPQLKRKTLDALNGKENVVMKKKLSAVIVLMIAVLLIGAAAIAAVSRAGILDFAGRYANTFVPEDAQNYVQTDVVTMENELVTVHLRELYYDGRISRMTVDVRPKDPQTMLLGFDMSPEDNWQNMTRINANWDETDQRTAIDVFRDGGYKEVYSTSSHLRTQDNQSLGGNSDYHLSEEGTLTLYSQVEYRDDQPEREVRLEVYLTPYSQPLASNSLKPEDRIVMEMPFTLRQASYQNETYVSTEAKEYPGAGVRVDEIRLEVRAQEIHAAVHYTIIDRETYDALENGLWFEFINPESTAEMPFEQRLQGGLTGSGSIGPTDGKDIETAVHFCQTETLGRNELHDTYTLRAYECWDKQRFETHTFTVVPANE